MSDTKTELTMRRHDVYACSRCSSVKEKAIFSPAYGQCLCPECMADRAFEVLEREFRIRDAKFPRPSRPPVDFLAYAVRMGFHVGTAREAATAVHEAICRRFLPNATLHPSHWMHDPTHVGRVPVMMGGVSRRLDASTFTTLWQRLLPDVALYNAEPVYTKPGSDGRRHKTGLFCVWVARADEWKLIRWNRRCFFDVDRVWYATTEDEAAALLRAEEVARGLYEPQNRNGTQRPVRCMSVEYPDKVLRVPNKWIIHCTPESDTSSDPAPQRAAAQQTAPLTLPCPFVHYAFLTGRVS